MTAIQLDSKLFHRRLRVLCTQWRTAKKLGGEPLGDVDTLLVHVGVPSESTVYQKSTALHFWLFGYEFPETILAIHLDGVFAITSPKKGSILESLNSYHDKYEHITVYKRGKDLSEQDKHFASLLEEIKRHGSKIGIFGKDKAESPLISDWTNYMKENGGSDITQVDVSTSLAGILSVKDEDEQLNMKLAGKCSSLIMQNFVVDQILTIIDEEKKVTHDQLSEKIESTILVPEGKKKEKVKFPSDVNLDNVEMCYPPIIQSGGNYSLRPSASSTHDMLHFGTILCSLGIRYKSYCSNMSRTFLIEPTKDQEANYKFLLDLQKYVVSLIRPEVSLQDVYNQGLAYVRENRPDLESHLTSNFGFGIGLEFRESEHLINSKNVRSINNGMTINLVLGFSDLTRSDSDKEVKKEGQKENDALRENTYALLVSDTVLVGKAENLVLTEGLKKLADISFFFKGEDEGSEETSDSGRADAKLGSTNTKRSKTDLPLEGPKVMKTRLRSEKGAGKSQLDAAAARRRDVHQKELAKEIIRQGLAKAAATSGETTGTSGTNIVPTRTIESYKRDALLPRETRDLQIVVDKRAESVLLPIYGQSVPFHISTIKNVSKSEEGVYLYLRINFTSPGRLAGPTAAGAAALPSVGLTDSTTQFVRAMSFRSADTARLLAVYKDITELRKVVANKEAELKERAGLVVQENLIELSYNNQQKMSGTPARRPLRLPDVYMRPALDGKRVPGDLEVHVNGIRYRSVLKSDIKTDILFSNIQHMFFQPCDHELIILVHFHLKNPILIGRKKTKDVHFYREALSAIVDETGGASGHGRGGGAFKRTRSIAGDTDEIMAEQEERKYRAALNTEFKVFCDQLTSHAPSLMVDIPIRTLGFPGVPFRQNVLLQPTRDCLVHLTDPPFLVVPLADVEVASLERVLFSLRNFDLIFIFKDKSIPPQHVDAIPMQYLEPIKEWLDSCDVYYISSNINYNWPNVLKTITEDPAGFYEMGGWHVIQANPDEEGSELGSDDSVSDEGDSVYTSSAEESDDDVSDSDSVASDDEDDSDAYTSDEDASASNSDEDEEDAMSWDELEEHTKKQERQEREQALKGKRR